MTETWTPPIDALPLGHSGDTVTVVEGSAFCISSYSGDIDPVQPHGLFFRDRRLLSLLEVRVNGARPEPLSSASPDPFTAVFVGRSRPPAGLADSTLMVHRHRYVGRGMREDIIINNFGEEAAYCSVEITIDADFADRSLVKEGRADVDADHACETIEDGFLLRERRGTRRRSVRITFSEKIQTLGNVARLEMIIPPRGEWSACIQVTPIIDDEEIQPRYACGQPVERATPVERLAKWRKGAPIIETDHRGLQHAVARSVEDLGALRIFDPDFPDRTMVAAGAPWFMNLFGRDSLITSWMALIVDPDLALGVLQTLARFQGAKVDPRNEEEPGRILHELRFGDAASMSLRHSRVYYGTVDATPLFVMLLGELRRWGLAAEAVDQLWPHADAAIEWIEDFGDRDGDGYVEYRRATDRGLAHQGWKDSAEAIRFSTGDVARPPIALAETQAYVYGAYVARAHFAEQAGDNEGAERWRGRAASLKAAFNRDFWLEDRGWFALALDHDKRPVDALASNMGHCLWTGIVDQDKAELVARRLLSPEMFSGWGVRTLATSTPGYNPISYHCGSVWPHDNAILAAGLMRYGFVEQAQRIVVAMIEAAATQHGRLPELFSGLPREEFPDLVSYPTSCSPQAWAAASPLLFLRTLLRLEPWIPHNKVWLAPALPPEIGRLVVDRIPLAGARVRVAVADGEVSIEGLPSHIQLITEPRAPLTAG